MVVAAGAPAGGFAAGAILVALGASGKFAAGAILVALGASGKFAGLENSGPLFFILSLRFFALLGSKTA